MAIASITQWLDGSRDFVEGRGLYEQYGSDPVVLAVIRTGSGTYHFSLLLEALEELNAQTNLQPKPITIPEVVMSKREAKGSPDLLGAPDELWQVRADKNLAYAQARALHERIRVMDSRDHRRDAALELLNKMDEVADAWQVLDEWKATGRVRELRKSETTKGVSELSLAELIKQEKNLQTYISKAKKRFATAAPEKRAKIGATLEANQHKLEEVRRRMNELV